MAMTARFVTVVALAASYFFAGAAGRAAPAAEDALPQEMLTLPVRVVDAEGQPVAGAVVIPWALRSSQGHGSWCEEGQGGSKPPTFTTDTDGRADTVYPRYSYPKERVRTLQVTLSIDHPRFARVEYEFIDVPRTDEVPHEIQLQRGATVEIVPLQDGKPAPLDHLYALWSDSRSWKPDFPPSITHDGALRLLPLLAGKGQILLARLDGERATHFSSIVDLQLEEGATVRQQVEIRPAVRIEGALSDNVPRPVKSGRLSARTVPREPGDETIDWFTWARIDENGTFVIEAWLAGEDVQIIALCDGYIAASGDVPPVAQKQGTSDFFHLPQVFTQQQIGERLVLRMTPTARCEIETVDQHGAPLAGVEVSSWPNVRWWNNGSQVYCTPLARGERLLVNRDFFASVDDAFPSPFQSVTDANGHTSLELPVGKEDLTADHRDYELPVNRGRREQEVIPVAGETTNVRLVLQPKGTEYLGDWDKLAGVLFGCTGEQCRRLLEDPGFRKKMVQVGKQFDEADDPTDPALLRSAYAEIAAGFDELKDQDEAEKWRRKSAEQAAKLAAPAEQP